MNPPSATQDNGGLGSAFIDDTIRHTPPSGTQIKSILIVATGTSFNTSMNAPNGNMADIDNALFGGGQAIFGIWDYVQLASGSCVVYYG